MATNQEMFILHLLLFLSPVATQQHGRFLKVLKAWELVGVM